MADTFSVNQIAVLAGTRRKASPLNEFTSLPDTGMATLFGVIERVVDAAAALLANGLAAIAYYSLSGANLYSKAHGLRNSEFGVIASVLFVVLLDGSGFYDKGNSLLRIRETERILRASVQTFLVLLPLLLFRLYPRMAYALSAVALATVAIIAKQLYITLIGYLHQHGHGVQRVVIYGSGLTGRRLFSALLRSPKFGLYPIAFIDDDSSLEGKRIFEYGYKGNRRSAPVIGRQISGSELKQYGATLIVVAIPSISQERLAEITEMAMNSGLSIAFVPSLSLGTNGPGSCIDIDGVLVAALERVGTKRVYAACKRIVDVSLSFCILVAAAPLCAVIHILIRCDSPGAALFTQDRVGERGRIFRIYKFRTMTVDSPKYHEHPGVSDDPRITKVGRWLRLTSFDELPQLINVLRGEMSLVGPRPEMPFLVAQYDERQMKRLAVAPGITGLWQLSADRTFQIHKNIGYDLYYIRYRSVFMDLAILFHTMFFAFGGR